MTCGLDGESGNPERRDRAWRNSGTSGSGITSWNLASWRWGFQCRGGGVPGPPPVSMSRCCPIAAVGERALRCARVQPTRDGAASDLPKEHRHLAWLSLDSRGRCGVLGGDGTDGAVCCGQSRRDPSSAAEHLGVEVLAGSENRHTLPGRNGTH